MLKILREFIEGDMQITEYTRDVVFNEETEEWEISPNASRSHKVEIPVQSEAPVKPLPPQETAEQKIERLEQQVQSDNLIMMEVMATIYEELLASKGSV